MMQRSSSIIAILILMMFHDSASAQTTSSLASCGNAFSGLLDEWRAAAFALPSKPGQAVVSGRNGYSSSGPGIAFMESQIRLAHFECDRGDSISALRRIALARRLIDESRPANQ